MNPLSVIDTFHRIYNVNKAMGFWSTPDCLCLKLDSFFFCFIWPFIATLDHIERESTTKDFSKFSKFFQNFEFNLCPRSIIYVVRGPSGLWWVLWKNRLFRVQNSTCSNRGVISWKIVRFLVILVPNIWQYFKMNKYDCTLSQCLKPLFVLLKASVCNFYQNFNIHTLRCDFFIYPWWTGP